MRMVRNAKSMNTWNVTGRLRAGSVLGCRAAAYTMNVISAQTSLGSHPQYSPHETFAQMAPTKMPMPSVVAAG